MILTAILTGVSVFIAGLLVLFIGLSAYKHEKQAFVFSLKSYFEAPDAETPSEFANLTELLSERFSQKLVNTAKGTFMGMQSVDAKNMNRVEGDVLTDMATQKNPLLGVIMTQYPTLARRLAKNPGLLPLVQNFMPKPGTGGSSPGGTNTDKGQGFFAEISKYGG